MARAKRAADDPDSYTAQVVASRNIHMMSNKSRVMRDKFIQALVLGNSRERAAIIAGCKPRSARKQGCTMWAEPYVQEQFHKLKNAIAEEDLVCKMDILRGLKAEAEDTECPSGTQAARVSAWNSLARILGVEKPQKVDMTMNGGVMIVPMIEGDSHDWERQAADQQQALKDAVRK